MSRALCCPPAVSARRFYSELNPWRRRLRSTPRPRSAMPGRRQPSLPNLLARSRGFPFGGAAKNSQNFFFPHNDEVFAIQLDLGTGVLAEQDAVAFLHIERTNLAFLVDLSLAGGDHFSLLRLVFGGIRNDDSTASGFRLFHATNQDAVVQRSEFRGHVSNSFQKFGVLVFELELLLLIAGTRK